MLEEVLSENVATDEWGPCPRGKQFDLIVVQVSEVAFTNDSGVK